MADSDPLWINAAAGAPAYNARELRTAFGGLLYPEDVDRFGARAGFAAVSPNFVSVTSTTWTTMDITAVVYPGVTSASGPYLVAHPADSGALNPPDGTNPRIDGLDLQIQDDDEDASGFRRARIVYVAGTPGASPSPPAVTANSLRLAEITVPASGQGSPSEKEVAPYTVARGGVLPVRDLTEYPTGWYVGQMLWDQERNQLLARIAGKWVTVGAPNMGRIATVLRTTNSSGVGTTESTINSISANLIAGATYKVTWDGDVNSSAADTVARLVIRQGGSSGALIQLRDVQCGAFSGRQNAFHVETEFTATATGSKTFAMTARQIGGAGTLTFEAFPEQPHFLYVDYIRN